MASYKFEYRLEMAPGVDDESNGKRVVEADVVLEKGDWLAFFRHPPQGGPATEYWRVRADKVVSMETKKTEPVRFRL